MATTSQPGSQSGVERELSPALEVRVQALLKRSDERHARPDLYSSQHDFLRLPDLREDLRTTEELVYAAHGSERMNQVFDAFTRDLANDDFLSDILSQDYGSSVVQGVLGREVASGKESFLVESIRRRAAKLAQPNLNTFHHVPLVRADIEALALLSDFPDHNDSTAAAAALIGERLADPEYRMEALRAPKGDRVVGMVATLQRMLGEDSFHLLDLKDRRAKLHAANQQFEQLSAIERSAYARDDIAATQALAQQDSTQSDLATALALISESLGSTDYAEEMAALPGAPELLAAVRRSDLVRGVPSAELRRILGRQEDALRNGSDFDAMSELGVQSAVRKDLSDLNALAADPALRSDFDKAIIAIDESAVYQSYRAVLNEMMPFDERSNLQRQVASRDHATRLDRMSAAAMTETTSPAGPSPFDRMRARHREADVRGGLGALPVDEIYNLAQLDAADLKLLASDPSRGRDFLAAIDRFVEPGRDNDDYRQSLGESITGDELRLHRARIEGLVGAYEAPRTAGTPVTKDADPFVTDDAEFSRIASRAATAAALVGGIQGMGAEDLALMAALDASDLALLAGDSGRQAEFLAAANQFVLPHRQDVGYRNAINEKLSGDELRQLIDRAAQAVGEVSSEQVFEPAAQAADAPHRASVRIGDRHQAATGVVGGLAAMSARAVEQMARQDAADLHMLASDPDRHQEFLAAGDIVRTNQQSNDLYRSSFAPFVMDKPQAEAVHTADSEFGEYAELVSPISDEVPSLFDQVEQSFDPAQGEGDDLSEDLDLGGTVPEDLLKPLSQDTGPVLPLDVDRRLDMPGDLGGIVPADLLSPLKADSLVEPSDPRGELDIPVFEEGQSEALSAGQDDLAMGTATEPRGGGLLDDEAKAASILRHLRGEDPFDEPEPEPPSGPELVDPNDPEAHLLDVAVALPDDDLSGFAPENAYRAPQLLSPEERAEAIAQVINDEGLNALSQTLVMDFGPLQRIAQHMADVCAAKVQPDLALAMTSIAHQAIHEVVENTPAIRDPGHTESGIRARQEGMADLKELLNERAEPALQRLEQAGVDVTSLRRGLFNVIETEERRLEGMSESLGPDSLGNRIIGGLLTFADELRAGPAPMTGALRRHRNDQLKHALSDLASVTREIRENAGNPEWEASTGPAAATLAKNLMGSIGEITLGVEAQLDHSAINAALGSAQGNMNEAAAKTKDLEQRRRLEEVAKMINEMIEKFAQMIMKLTGLSTNKKDAPQAASVLPRPAPR